MIWTIAAILLMAFIVYDLAPNIYARNFSPGIVRTLDSPGVALTFDDGPNSVYTAQLLDILAEYNIPATFFVLAENAADNPHLIERMRRDGHAIGIHSANHRPAWLSTPWQTARDFEHCREAFRKLNLPVTLYRPPWGTFNLFTLCIARKYHLQTVLWSLSPDDWRRNSTPEGIAEAIIDRVGSQDIILLHDNGGAAGAPAKTIEALKTIIPTLKSQGYDFVTVPQEG